MMEPIVSATLATQHYHTTCVVGADGRHEFVCDEPLDLGGQDLGPTPVEVFCGSVAACKAMTARMYADRKEWSVESISCTVRHTLRVQEGSDRPTKVPHLDITIQFTGTIDDEQRARLKEIAERCPVQRMIEGECVVTTELA